MIEVYEFHGCSLEPTNSRKTQYQGNCLFCGDKDHFFVNPSNGLFDCKKCGVEGNPQVFITKLWEHCFQETEIVDGYYKELIDKRSGITFEALYQAGFAYDYNMDRWIVPYFNGGKCLSNLGSFKPKSGFRIFKTPTMDLKLYDPFTRTEWGAGSTILLTEGEWDLLAIKPIIDEHTDWAVVAAPGATVFKDEYVSLFAGRNVIIAYDKDDAGRRGIAKVANALTGVAASVKFLKWPADDFPDVDGVEGQGKDLRDLVQWKIRSSQESKMKRKPNPSTTTINFIRENLETPESDANSAATYISSKYTLPPVEEVESWNDLITTFRNNLYLTPSNEAAIAICLATAISPRFPGEPLWIFLIGPPSCGKTTLIESFGTSNIYCEAQSQISANMLVSGWKLPNGEDVSALPTLNQRTLLIKDYTAVLSMSRHEQELLYGILRDAFDGSFRKQYGNAKVCNYQDVKFSMIAGVTKAIYGDNRSSLGERFLKVEYLDRDEFDEITHVKAGMAGNNNREQRATTLQTNMLGYLHHLIENLPSQDEIADPPIHFEEKITLLALLVARLRAQVERGGDDALLYRPEVEVGTRLGVQFKKMSQCLMVVLNKDMRDPNQWDDDVYRIIRKLALDSCIPFNVEFAKRMHQYPNGITRKNLAHHLQIPNTNIHRILMDLQQIGIVRMRELKSGNRGRPEEAYTLSQELQGLWSETVQKDLYGNPIDGPKVQEKVELPKRVIKRVANRTTRRVAE